MENLVNNTQLEEDFKKKQIEYISILSTLEINSTFSTNRKTLCINDETNKISLKDTLLLESHNLPFCYYRLEKDFQNIQSLTHSNKLIKNYFSKGILFLGSKFPLKLTENQVKSTIKTFFDSTTADSSVLFLSGYGVPETGDFILQTKESETFLKYEEIIFYWNSRQTKEKNKYLLIILDSCYSGTWVEKNEKSKNYLESIGIFIQASSTIHQKNIDCPEIGGILTYNLAQLNLNSFNKLMNENIDTYQKPTFSGSTNIILTEFGIKIMYDSWNKFKEINFYKENYEDGDYFTGKFINNKKNGYGIYNHNDGQKFEGEWVNNTKCGFGLKYDKNCKLIYKGYFKDDNFNGIGKYFNALNFYEGNFLYNKRNGFGMYIWNTGEKYEGEWLNDKKSGMGIYYDINNKMIYKGQWRLNNYNGEGTSYEEQGIYEGNFLNDKKSGFGIYTWKNGEKYEGEWIFDKKTGFGRKFDENNTLEYEGDWKDNNYHGKGSIFYDNGDVYHGTFSNGDIYGVGLYISSSKEKYEGEWFNNQRNGIGRFYNENNKLEYEGEFKDNKYHGKGKLYFDDGVYEGDFYNDEIKGFGIYKLNTGDKFEGEWLNNKIIGIGKKYDINSKLVYEGEFQNYIYHGKGKRFYENGHYEGNFINYKRNGFGIYTWNDGEKYEGEWINDKRSGIGKIYGKNNNILYEGEWKDSKYNGRGKLYNGEDIYDGVFLNGKKNGLGILIYGNGCRFKGKWKLDKKDGFGKYYGKNYKKEYEGEWKNDKYNGYGKCYFDNGDIYQGEFLKDKRNGYGIYCWNDGDYYEGEWVNDNRIGNGVKYNKEMQIVYVGEWKYRKYHGIGRHWYDNGDVYEGEFFNGKRNGRGIYLCADAGRYEGEWLIDERCGYGLEFEKNGGIVYEGEWKKDKYSDKKGFKVNASNWEKIEQEISEDINSNIVDEI